MTEIAAACAANSGFCDHNSANCVTASGNCDLVSVNTVREGEGWG